MFLKDIAILPYLLSSLFLFIEMLTLKRSSFVILFLFFVIQCQSTPLDDYVHADDHHFGWKLIQIYEEIDYRLYILNFTSQKWLDRLKLDLERDKKRILLF
jgi:hypothetical protein